VAEKVKKASSSSCSAATTNTAKREALEARAQKLIKANEELWLGSIVEANEMGGAADFD